MFWLAGSAAATQTADSHVLCAPIKHPDLHLLLLRCPMDPLPPNAMRQCHHPVHSYPGNTPSWRRVEAEKVVYSHACTVLMHLPYMTCASLWFLQHDPRADCGECNAGTPLAHQLDPVSPRTLCQVLQRGHLPSAPALTLAAPVVAQLELAASSATLFRRVGRMPLQPNAYDALD